MNREYYSNYWNPDRLQIRYLFGETKERGTVRLLEDYLLIGNIGFVLSYHKEFAILLFYFEEWRSNGFPIGIIKER